MKSLGIIKSSRTNFTLPQMLSNIEIFYLQGIHGIEHAYKVLLITQELGKLEKLSVNQQELLEFCAIFHDIGRVNDYADSTHGIRSIYKLKQNQFFGLTKFDNELTKYIIENHCITDNIAFHNINNYDFDENEEALYLLKIFKDADNLDRFRIGDFDPSYLRMLNSHKLIAFAEELNTRSYDHNEIIKQFKAVIEHKK